MPAELVLAVVAAADLCLKYGKALAVVYRDIKGAEEGVRSKLLLVEAIWSKTATQVDFLKRVAGVLEEEHCRIHLEILQVLQGKLTISISKIESVVKGGSSGSEVKRWKYARLREAIDDSISELQQWQSIFDPTWYLILRMGNRFIDDELSKQSDELAVETLSLQTSSTSSSGNSALASAQDLRHTLKGDGGSVMHISLPENGLEWETAREVEYSTTVLVKRQGSDRVFAVDTISCRAEYDILRVRTDAEGLAKKLKRDDIGIFGLLSCKGVVKRKDADTRRLASLGLVFQLPSIFHSTAATPVSLRSHLLRERSFSVSRVLDVAKQLARAVSFVHTVDFVHKNIRPETILVFPDHDSGSPSELGAAFLLGFDSFRNINFHTLKMGDEAWERNLYRHPSRQGLHAQEAYIMQHDVYSLGVCLLEIGLWDSFVQYGSPLDDETKREKVPVPGRRLSDGLESVLCEDGDIAGKMKVKDELVSLARSRLPLCMGNRYAAVVVTCLTCLDEDTEEFMGEDMQDEDGILVGVRFIEKVLVRLGEIVI
ncbi:het-s domain protein [Colletotrichum tabaci]|uniref:Het-s domain protein n=1 Tax=Colletotrichum tabaci TaxID=1209068 RepID=A0AAV9SW32_9PEZI